MIDSYKNKGQRKQLVETIQRKGITDARVLEAVGTVPRHLFMEKYLEDSAYEDRALPIGAGQTISQPYTVAFQTALLEIQKGDKVLEIGTGSGYQTAILLEMQAKVYTIERQRSLYAQTRKLLIKLGYQPYFFFGDGYEGKPGYAPFDKILITAGAPFVPNLLLRQLKTGGMLVAPIGGQGRQVMTKIIRTSENDFRKEEHGYFVFVPMLKGTEK